MAWYMLGQSLEQESETAKALAAWRKAIAIDPKFSQALFSLARALRSTDQAESEQLMARYIAVQKERRILDRADTLANNGIEAASAHDWPEAIRQLKEAIAACGDCAAKADLHRKLGIIDCQAGDLENGEKELLAAKALKPDDPVTQAALELVARAGASTPQGKRVDPDEKRRVSCSPRRRVPALGSRKQCSYSALFRRRTRTYISSQCVEETESYSDLKQEIGFLAMFDWPCAPRRKFLPRHAQSARSPSSQADSAEQKGTPASAKRSMLTALTEDEIRRI